MMVKKILVKLVYIVLLMVGNLYDFSEDNKIYPADYVCYENSILEREEDIDIELIVSSENILPVSLSITSKSFNIKQTNYTSIEIFKPPKLS